MLQEHLNIDGYEVLAYDRQEKQVRLDKGKLAQQFEVDAVTVETASPLKRKEIIEALRIGAVPRRGLELFAVGLERFENAIDEELDAVAAGRGKFKAVRGEYGTGKTFFARWLEHRARAPRVRDDARADLGDRDAALQAADGVSARIEALQTQEWSRRRVRQPDRSLALQPRRRGHRRRGGVDRRPDAFGAAVGDLLERRLADVSKTQPQFAAALRALLRRRA
jgi:hypothetical protein